MATNEMTFIKRNPLSSFVGIIAWSGIIILPLIALFAGGNDWDLVLTLFLLIFIIWFLPLSTILNYFGVGPYHIEVRNHHLLWRKRKYYFDDVDEVVLGTIGNSNKCITIFLKNGKKKRFQGASLNDENWRGIKHALIERKVKVNDENNLDEVVTPIMKKYRKKLILWLMIWAIPTSGLSLLLFDYVSEDRWALRLVLFLSLGAVSLFSIKRIMRRIGQLYTEEEESEKNGGV